MRRSLTYLVLLALLFSCSEPVQADATEAVAVEKAVVSADKKNDMDRTEIVAQVDAELRDCLMASDSTEVLSFLAIMRTYIQNGDDTSIGSKIKVSDDYSHDSTADMISYVKDFLIEDFISSGEQSELQSSNRFYNDEESPCSYYLITRNFSESEFAVVFFLAKSEGEIIISRIELAG